MLILLYTTKAAPAAGSTDWTNAGTAIGTIALAILTFATLVFTVVATTRERRQAATDRAAAEKRLEDERSQAARDRAAAEKRLEDERAAGDQRMRDERAYAAEVRRRDRQIDNASVLVARIAELQALMTDVPGASLWADRGRGSQSAIDALTAISSLRHGAWTEAAMLGTGEAAEEAASRYRTLVRLVDEASRAQTPPPFPERDMDALRNYARFVLLSLRTLADDETVPPIQGGSAERPLFGLAAHMPAWLPNPIPPGWDDIAEADPPVRRSARVTVGTDAKAKQRDKGALLAGDNAPAPSPTS